MPDFGIKTALSEFGKAVDGRRFKHPETGNMVLYTSLPMDEQHRIYEQWKQYQSLVEQAPKEGTKVTDVKALKKGDVVTIQGPKASIQARVTALSEGKAVAQKIDPKTGKATGDKPFSISQEAVDSFDVRTIQPGKVDNPFANREEWAPVALDDVFENDVVAYRAKGKDRMGRVTRVSEDGTKFWVQEVDPKTGKVRDKTERSFDEKKLEERDARLVDEDLWGEFGDEEEEPGPSWMSGWSGKAPKKKELTPEEKEKLEAERKKAEEDRKKAVEEMGKTGKPLDSTKDVKVGDVVSYHHKGNVYHGRVIDSRGHEFFTIDIDPETGELKEHGFEEFRGHNLGKMDVHKVDEEHVPPDPAEANEKALYEGLPKLEEDPKKYFQDRKDSQLVDMSKIQPAKVRLKGVLNGNELLGLAAEGKYGKRKPISLIDNGDGTYTVRDGNSTYKNAEISGWEQIPAVIKTKEEWDAHDKEEEKKKQQQKSLWPPSSSHGQPKVTKEPAPKEKPESFQGEALTSTEGLKKGDLFGYEHDGRWYVGKVDRVGKDGELFVDSLHPDNGDLTTLKYIRFDDTKLARAKAMRLKDDHEFPKRKKKPPPKPPPKGAPKKPVSEGKPDSGKPFMFASRRAALEELRAAAEVLAYRPRWQDTPGYKTVVDVDSEKGIYPAQTDSSDLDRGQDNLDAAWPVQAPQSREKERALPLPSNHSTKREKRIGPTTYNKPRHIPYRTLDEKGDEYGHPTKYDYNMPTRRVDGPTAFDEDGIEPVAVERQGPFPKQHQQNQAGPAKLKSKQEYRQHPQKKRKMRMKYRLRDKRKPRKKLMNKYYRMYPNRFKRRGIGFRTPAERTKAWREDQAIERTRKGITPKEQAEERDRERNAGMGVLAEAFDMLGLDLFGADWPSDWNTQVKDTKGPQQLDQNYGKGQSRGQGTPRKDPTKQKGESLRAPDLSAKPQKGLKWEIEPPAPGGLDYPDDKARNLSNPTDGSGKVLPMSYYTDFANNTQQVPDGRQDRYLHNNNFDVKQATREFIRELCDPEFGRGSRTAGGHARVAMTVADILKRCDKKIKERSREYTPKLARTDTKNWIWHWSVGDHTVRVQALKRGNASSFPKLNLRVSCSCPYWRWWGPAHWATKRDYQKGKAPGTASYPEIRDPARWRPVCKHAYAVLEKSQDFFVRPAKSPLKRLGSRFSVDSAAAIEVVIEEQDIVTRVAQRASELDIVRRVARRYVGEEDT